MKKEKTRIIFGKPRVVVQKNGLPLPELMRRARDKAEKDSLGEIAEPVELTKEFLLSDRVYDAGSEGVCIKRTNRRWEDLANRRLALVYMADGGLINVSPEYIRVMPSRPHANSV